MIEKPVLERPLPGEWESADTTFDYHWNIDGEYPSIRIMDSMYPNYPVEIYPSPEPDNDGVERSVHESLEGAIKHVRELMEEHPEGY